MVSTKGANLDQKMKIKVWNRGGWSDSLLWALGSVDHKVLDKNCKESMDSAHYSRYSSQSCHSSHNSHSSYSSQYRTDTAKESMASVHQATSAMLYQRIKACWRTSWTQTLHKLNTNGTSWTQHNTAQAEEKLHRADLTLCLRYNFVPLVCS